MAKKQKIIHIDSKTLKAFMKDAFQAAGVPETDAEICSKVLIAADIRGIDTHGINRLKKIYLDRIKEGILKPETEIEVVQDKGSTAVLDGHDGMGFVVSRKAMEMAIENAKKFGMGMVAVRNSSHYGIAGYYPLMAVEKNMIGITGTNARPSMAPTYGVENMMGTNPLTVAMPTDEDFPFFLDCATSIAQRGKVELYAREGKGIPEGWVISEDGKSETEPGTILKGLMDGVMSFVPLGGIGEDLGGHKGYGYALIVEILSAALQDGKFLKDVSGFDKKGNKVPHQLGHFFIAVDIAHFIKPERFKEIAGTILRTVRKSKKMPDQKKIFTPGEKEHIAMKERLKKGVPINENMKKEMIQIIEEYGLKKYLEILQ